MLIYPVVVAAVGFRIWLSQFWFRPSVIIQLLFIEIANSQYQVISCFVASSLAGSAAGEKGFDGIEKIGFQ